MFALGYIGGFLKAQAEKASQQTALRLQEEMARDTYEHIRSQAEETAIMRHDLQKHLNTLGGLLAGDRSQELKIILQKLPKKQNKFPKF